MKTFLALYTGTPQPGGAPPPMDPKDMEKGMQAWGDWMNRHAGDVVETGGPLGKTKKVSKSGIADVRNNAAGYVVVRAESQEAAAKLFEGHPHFTTFPGDGVEVMEVLPVPNA